MWPGIFAGLGLLQNVIGQGKADSARNRAMSLEEQKAQMEREINQRRIDQYDKVQKLVDEARKGGVYDPNAWAKNYATDFNKNAATLQNRTNENLLNSGYAPSDSEFKYITDRLDRTLNHDLAVGQVGARQNAVTAEANALAMPGQTQLPNVNSQLPSYLMQQSQDQQPDWGGTLQGILPLIQGWGKNKTGGGGSGNNGFLDNWLHQGQAHL